MLFTQTRRSLIVSAGCALLASAAPSLLTTPPVLRPGSQRPARHPAKAGRGRSPSTSEASTQILG